MKRLPRLTAVLVAALLVLAAAWQAPAATSEALLKAARQERDALEKDAKAQQFRHNWQNVITRYEKVLEAYPKGVAAEASLLAIGDLYLGLYRVSRIRPDLDAALASYRRLTRDFKGALAAEAQLSIGRIYLYHLKDPEKAYLEFLKVELNHPQAGEAVKKARALMSEASGQVPPPTGGPAEVPAGTSVKTPEKPAPDAPAAGTAVVRGVKHWHNDDYSRVAVDVSQPVRFEEHVLKADKNANLPRRLYIDLEKAALAPGLASTVPIDDGLLTQVRVAQHTPTRVRVVLDLDRIQNYRVFALNDPYKVVIDVTGGDKPPPEVKKEPEPEKAPPVPDLTEAARKRKKVPRGPARDEPSASSLARQLGLGVRRVVIDPGHGGKDCGAIGVGGLQEKDIVLRASLMLAERLRKELGLEVIMTRSSDKFLPLEERTALANTHAADLFLSIHVNAHESASVSGIETYFLNLATDKEAMRVAAKENAATQKNMSDLQMILGDLMLNSKITESSRLAEVVHKGMLKEVSGRYKGVRNLKVKQAPFYVLIGANMPSVLVELGFITNKTESNRMTNEKYLSRLLDGIVAGIKEYSRSIKQPG